MRMALQGNVGLVTGSHNRNEIVVIPLNGEFRMKVAEQLSKQVCQICGDDVGVTADGEPFIACNECAFPICKTCYDYERREGNQVCPQCKTRFIRLKGCARVDGDEEEDGIDDLENELNLNGQASNTPLLQSQLDISLLADCQMGDEISQEKHALVLSHVAKADVNAVQPRPLDPSKDLAAYGYGTVAWKERIENWKKNQENRLSKDKETNGSSDNTDLPLMEEGRLPLSRKIPIPSSEINPYRMIIIIRLLVLGFFFHYRVTHPVDDAYALWLVSVICEIWFALSWILDQFPKWNPYNRETYPDRLSMRYDKEGQPSQLSQVDVFVCTFDPVKEPPLLTVNTILSILAVDYPIDKVSCYVSDDKADILTFEMLSETSEFARKWVPFCKKFEIEPRAPECYFNQKMDYLKDRVHASFMKERSVMKREYEDFKIRMNTLVAKAQKKPEDGWTMQDGTPWPGNDPSDHPGMIQVFLGQSGGHDKDGHELPCLVYVSREKRPGFNDQNRAGAMNALIRVSAILSNAPYLLNLECGHYINNSKALKEAMCFMMDPLLAKKVCYVQFPKSFDGIDWHNQYANRNKVFFDINMKALDGIQGPICVGTGCVFKRQALCGYDAPKINKSGPKMYNCWSNWCSTYCCFGSKNKRKAKKHMYEMKKNSLTSFTTLNALEGVEENTDGKAHNS